jgi:hypothetical protein
VLNGPCFPGNDGILALRPPIRFKIAGSMWKQDIRGLEPPQPAERHRNLRKDRVPVSQVYPESLQSLERMRVDGFGNEHAAGLELFDGRIEEGYRCVVVEVLDDMGGDDRAERRIRLCPQEFNAVRKDHVQALFPALIDHILVSVHTSRVQPCVSQQLEQLSATAANVEYRLRTFQ